ncbi:MAG: aldo/keto reductase [Eubacteriales bacterium]|nr:aldo/keto reductase [Eubacteriales bacterium]
MKDINLILGTMQFGERVFGYDSRAMISAFGDSGYTMLDTAYVYNDGESERLIGAALPELKRKYNIATKVNPRITGKLDKAAVVSQLNESLNRLHLPSVDILYLHFPDPNTPVESALEGCAELYAQGKFRELGLSNFPAWLVAEVHSICARNGWMLPTVYEGLYNPLSRHAERELDMCLSYYNMRFYAYNPLAGGLMTDKYKDRIVSDGRFTNRPNYQKRYWHDSYFAAIDVIRSVCEPHGITIAEAAYRWLTHHSMLKTERGDGIIIGASSIPQLTGNIAAVQRGALPDDVVSAINDAWEKSRADAPEYFTFYKSKA